MGVRSRHQIVVLEAGGGGRAERLKATLRRQFRDLGIAARAQPVFLSQSDDDVNPNAPLMGVYFGGRSQNAKATAIVQRLLARPAFVLPVVPTLDGYTRLVPDCLHPINGMAEAPDDHGLVRVANRVLEELRFVRGRRRVFISYRRVVSREAAVQLYHALDEASFDVFLDTHGVASGKPFQFALWDQLSDADIVILLDAPTTLSSSWVAEEFARANAWGIGILQVVWPDHTRAPETALCEPHYLKDSDFRRGNKRAFGGQSLTDQAIAEIAVAAEALRARSFAARQARLIRRFCEEARAAGLTPAIQSTNRVDVTTARRRFHVTPVVGHPDSMLAHETFTTCQPDRRHGVLLYDPIGMLDGRVAHLKWLGKHLPDPVKLLAVTEVSS